MAMEENCRLSSLHQSPAPQTPTMLGGDNACCLPKVLLKTPLFVPDVTAISVHCATIRLAEDSTDNREGLFLRESWLLRGNPGQSTELVAARPDASFCASAGSQKRVLLALRGAASTGAGLKHQYLSFKKRKKKIIRLEGLFYSL